MKKILTASVFLLLVAVIFRSIQTIGPNGGGQYLASPNGSYEAHASDLNDKYFWGGQRDYYEFVIIDNKSRKTIRTIQMDTKNEEIYEMRQDPSIISWSTDSSEVSFKLPGIDLKLKSSPTKVATPDANNGRR